MQKQNKILMEIGAAITKDLTDKSALGPNEKTEVSKVMDRMLMNVHTGSVATVGEWYGDMAEFEGNQKAQFESLVEVEMIDGSWTEVA